MEKSGINILDTATPRRPLSRSLFGRILASREMSLVLVTSVVAIVIGILRPDQFLDSGNFNAIATNMIYDLLLASGMTLVLILGGIDLSVGSVLALTSVATAVMLQTGLPITLSIIAGLCVAACAGAVNGLCVAWLGIAPFIATLAMMSIARGYSYVQSLGNAVSELPAQFVAMKRVEFAGLGVPFLATFLILASLDLLLRTWKPLNQAFYIGTNRAAATLSGIRSRLVTFSGYVVCALLAGVAGIFMTSSLGMGSASFGKTYELNAIAAAVIGGASLTGGAGSILGACLGVVLLAVINNGFVLLGGEPNWQKAVSGGILIVAVAVDAWRRRKQRRE